MPLDPRLAELERILREAGRLGLDCRTRLQRELKPDGSVVTNGDRVIETYLRAEVSQLVPHAAIWGEEFGYESENEHGQWLLDPIDGTTNYAFGSPIWGVSIALVRDGIVTLGGIALPEFGEILVGGAGLGAFKNRERLDMVPSGPIESYEPVSYGSIVMRSGNAPGKMRCSGCFVVDGAFVASQRIRGLIGMNEHLYDVAGCLAIANEVGVDVRYADGRAFDLPALQTGKKIAEPWLMFPAESGYFLGAS